MLATDLPARPFDAVTYPLQRRNAVADWMFYDVSGLTAAEFNTLSRQINREGSILVVYPADHARDNGVRKFDTFASFRAEPGDLLRHFTIAGVGSSDIGAAALARTLANHVDAPVGAIVAGYGMADLLSEAMGGWFFFGMHNRLLNYVSRLPDTAEWGFSSHGDAAVTATSEPHGIDLSPDTLTLLRLLGEPERTIETILGHSKGCLSIAYALQTLKAQDKRDGFARATDTEIVTTGAVVAVPSGLQRVRQYLGGIDWFGGMNSRRQLDHVDVPGAWHHLNKRIPFHMDLDAVLAGRFDLT